jgi:3-isopropylmalate dehydrogenase
MASTYDIAVLKGDGIGPDVVDEALKVLEAAVSSGGPRLVFEEYPSGADCYVETGDPLPEATVDACRSAAAVLLGAMGHPDVRWPDGTEITPQVELRFKLDLYAGVRPIYLYAAHHTPLKDLGKGDIDLVVLRESTEGLFASMNGGIELRGETAVDSMVITRFGTERVARYAFELARQRHHESGGGEAVVTCVDKANIFRSMAFFRSVFKDVALQFEDVEPGYEYVDAMAFHLVERPQVYDVLVMENMFGDIISDLAAGLIGGMGMAPSGDIGDESAIFQPSHGTAPDIAGKGIANPVGAILSAAMMLGWLGHQHDDESATRAGERIQKAVGEVMADPAAATPDLKGKMTTSELGSAIAAAV